MPLVHDKRIRTRKRGDEAPRFWVQILKGVLRLLLLSTVLVITWYVTRLHFFTITDIEVRGGVTIPHESLETKVHGDLQGTYLLIIPKTFSYLYPHDHIIDILKQDRRIQSITLSREGRNKLMVDFTEYVPFALWCGKDTTKPCYYITREGYAYSEAPTMNGGAFIRHIDDTVDTVNEGQVISAEELERIYSFIERLQRELKFRVTSLSYSKEHDITYYVNGGGMIYTSRNRDVLDTFTNLKSVLKSKEFKHLEPGNFKYIDVRFGSKVYVNEQLSDTVATSTADATTTLPQ